MRASKLDPVPNLGDGWTEPGNLHQSAALAFKYSLVPAPPKTMQSPVEVMQDTAELLKPVVAANKRRTKKRRAKR